MVLSIKAQSMHSRFQHARGPPLECERRHLQLINNSRFPRGPWRETNASQPAIHAVKIPVPGGFIALPQHAERDRHSVAVLNPVRVTRRDVNALAWRQLHVFGESLELGRIGRQLAVALVKRVNLRFAQHAPIGAIHDRKFFAAAKLQQEVVFLVQVKGRRSAWRTHEDVGTNTANTWRQCLCMFRKLVHDFVQKKLVFRISTYVPQLHPRVTAFDLRHCFLHRQGGLLQVACHKGLARRLLRINGNGSSLDINLVDSVVAPKIQHRVGSPGGGKLLGKTHKPRQFKQRVPDQRVSDLERLVIKVGSERSWMNKQHG